MQRPKSIVDFQWVYLTAIVLGVVNVLISWGYTQELVAYTVAQTPGAPGLGSVPLISTVVALAIQLALLYFIAVRASPFAKWVFVVFVALAIIINLPGLFVSPPAGAPQPPRLAAVLSIVNIVLGVIAAWLLFKPDANAWFTDSGKVPANDPLDGRRP